VTVDWYLKEEAEKVENPEKYNHTNPDWRVPVLFYDGSKWRQDMASLTEQEFNRLEPAGRKFGNKVWRLESE
jgi:hypothetical protein